MSREISIRFVYGDDANVAAWVGGHLNIVFHPPFLAVGLTDDERTYCGGVVFNGWNGSNLDFSVHLNVRLTRQMMRELYRYVFEVAKANRLSMITPRSKKRVRKLLNKHFKFECVKERYFGPERKDDGFAYVLFKEKARTY